MNTTSILPLPASISLEALEHQATDLLKAGKKGGIQLIDSIQQHFPVFLELKEYEIQAEKFTVPDAHFIVCRSYGFESWQQFITFVHELTIPTSVVAQFEAAADAIANGDAAALFTLLSENPELIWARSKRIHHATLLHYVSANGIEDFRQKTPANAVAIAEILLRAGAEPDAVLADGQSTTLGLVATSIHPAQARVQIALLDLLLKAGASAEGVPGGWKPLSAALANGCPEAARFLASLGSSLSDAIARQSADPGWIKNFLDRALTRSKLEAGLMWACEQGQDRIVKILIDRGVDIHSQEYTGLTALHWAVAGGQISTIRLLLKHGASVTTKNIYGGNALDQALWWHMNGKPLDNHLQVVKLLLESGSKPEEGTLFWLAKQRNLSEESRGRLEQLLRLYGTDS